MDLTDNWPWFDVFPPSSAPPPPPAACSQLSGSWGKHRGSSLLSSTTGWSDRKSRQSRAARSHWSSLTGRSARSKKTEWMKSQIFTLNDYTFHSSDILSVSEGLEDLSVQVIAAVDQVWIIVRRPVTWWRLDLAAVKQPFQKGDLNQV